MNVEFNYDEHASGSYASPTSSTTSFSFSGDGQLSLMRKFWCSLRGREKWEALVARLLLRLLDLCLIDSITTLLQEEPPVYWNSSLSLGSRLES
eukprot:CAMPEP_0202968978 /NCGR_PEP_ID=MMETSP1396-20130829/14545_1 /ASSEMBLY_ACC=CAM_ASM_000872 /TAXON_ID= /ORGANISM="Pseudokeronopsis sp., Strain Brazil" /LENGTH=93 /DNA_ID=CAMNT_0049695985 /DNA_START=64 /DNA_END=341 /DNA_ORIENTATION=-